jgi:hypothetical protein
MRPSPAAATPPAPAGTGGPGHRSVPGGRPRSWHAAASTLQGPGLTSCSVYRFTTRRRCGDLRFGRMSWLRQNRGSWLSSALPDRDQGLWLAGAARPRPGVQERGDHGAPARGHAAAASGRPAEAGLGRPGGPGGARLLAACRPARPPARYAGHTAGLASPPDQTEVDASGPARSAGDQPGHPRPGALPEPGMAGCQWEHWILDVAGLSWTSWDMIQKVRRADQAHSEATDATRTERGFHSARNGESAGQRAFRWAGMGSL